MKVRSLRYSVVIASTHIAGIRIRGTSREQSFVVSVDSAEPLREAVLRCLRTLLVPLGIRRQTCTFLIAPSLCQVRRIEDVPASASSVETLAMVRHAAIEHFLGDSNALSFVVAERDARASGAWVMAVDKILLNAILSVASSLRVRPESILPVIDVCAATLQSKSGVATWSDADGISGHADVVNARMTRAWRSRSSLIADSTTIEAELVAMAEIGATPPHDAVFRKAVWPEPVANTAWFAASAPFFAAALATLLLVCLPLFRAHRALSVLSKTEEELQVPYMSARDQRLKLDSIHLLAREVEVLRRTGVDGLEILAQVTAALGEDSYMTQMTADTAAVQVVIVGPEATSILTALAERPGVDSVSVVGAVTRDLSAPASQAPSGLPASIEAVADENPRVRMSIRFISRTPTVRANPMLDLNPSTIAGDPPRIVR